MEDAESEFFIAWVATRERASKLASDYAKVLRDLGKAWRYSIDVRRSALEGYAVWVTKRAVLPDDA